MWNTIKRIIGNRSASTVTEPATRQSRPCVESLESRQLMSVSLVGSTLVIVGGPGVDSAHFGPIRDAYGRNVYRVDGQVDGRQELRDFDVSRISAVQFFGYGGRDGFENNSFVPAYINGGADGDRLIGGYAYDVIVGEGGDDLIKDNSLRATANWDNYLYGGPGNDQIIGSDANDVVYAGEGNDQIGGGNAIDAIYGEDGDDLIEGGNGNDYLFGGAGNDRMAGGAGNDWVYGQAGADVCYGNSGADLFDRDGYDVARDLLTYEGDRFA
jgi:Ca2+-binding RTX toxin-like protein